MNGYLVDNNLPESLGCWQGERCQFVKRIEPAWTDGEIWACAREARLTIVTKDADFEFRCLQAAGDAPRVIHLRLGNLRLRELDSFMKLHWPEIKRLGDVCRLVAVYPDGRVTAR